MMQLPASDGRIQPAAEVHFPVLPATQSKTLTCAVATENNAMRTKRIGIIFVVFANMILLHSSVTSFFNFFCLGVKKLKNEVTDICNNIYTHKHHHK